MLSPVMSSWSVAVRGIAALVFGFIALFLPGPALFALVFLFGAYALADGIFAIVSAVREDPEYGRGWLVLEGIVGIVVGLATFVWPGITAVALTYLIAAWAIVTGILEIAGAIRLRRYINREWLYILGGALSVLLGVLIMGRPLIGALTLTWMLGVYGIFFGAMLLGLSFNLRKLERSGAIPPEEEERRAA